MTTANKNSDNDLAVQEHCIDLPGESVQCWIGGGTDKLKVVLRKHRDVIFDIHLGNGKTYTLETTESDFYNVRDKKLVYAARHGKVTFSDGERIHVWVSRGFRGALILKCGEHVLSEVRPNEWDTDRHSDDPKEKPAPIIIALATAASTPHLPAQPKLASPASHPSDTNAQLEQQSLHVHQVSRDEAPSSVINFFENGGESLHLDTSNVITRNWITAQLAGAPGYILDNHTWITELSGCNFKLQKVIHKSGPKVYIIFSGNNKLRKVILASRYSLQHTKILKITSGAGGIKQAWDATKGAVKDSLKAIAKEEGKFVLKGGGIAVYFAIAMDIAEWHKDYAEIGPEGKPKKDLCDLFAKVGTDLAKAGLIAALTTASVAFLVGATSVVGLTVASPVLLIVAGTIAVSVSWTYLVELADKAIGHALGKDDTSSWLAKKFREIATYLAKTSKDVRYEHYAAIPL
jgi:hypothetical protein